MALKVALRSYLGFWDAEQSFRQVSSAIPAELRDVLLQFQGALGFERSRRL